MKFLTPIPVILLGLCLFSPLTSATAQESKIQVSSDPRIESLMNEKRRINSSITVNDRYKIQIFTGDSDNARKMLSDFKKQFPKYDATVVFHTPAYKVWAGNFKTRIDAERNLELVRKVYKNAFLIKPNR